MLYRLFELLKPLLGIALVAGLLALPLIFFFARFGDGPLGPFPGGPLQGPIEPAPESWGAASRARSAELQIGADPPRSVRTGLVWHQGTLYLPVILEPLARWDDAVVDDPQVLVRIDGRLYERRAAPVYDPEWKEVVREAAVRKYGAWLYGEPLSRWDGFFRLDPP